MSVWLDEHENSGQAVVRSASIRAMNPTSTNWGQVLLRAAGVFIVTYSLFYFLAFDDTSLVYTESDGRLLVVTVAWIAVGVLLLAARQRTWGLAWLIGSVACIGGYLLLVLAVVFSMGS
jgi:hypothetical protein